MLFQPGCGQYDHLEPNPTERHLQEYKEPNKATEEDVAAPIFEYI